MADDSRVQDLLNELLASGGTPETVCRSCPELLPEIRKQSRRILLLRADLDALFPPHGEEAALAKETELPQVPGYKVEAVLGQGGMGIVFRARHLRLNRLVALKMLLPGSYAAPRDLTRFQREAEAVAGFRHANIVQVHDVGDVDGRPYYTMEYVEGGSLAHQLVGAPQPVRRAAQLVATLAEAVQSAHERGIVHRDLKPANVLLAADGTPKVADFGLARHQDDGGGMTHIGVAVGTPSYMAPEQAQGRPEAIGPAADIYALGAILYELLTGRPPFRAATSAETVQQVISQEPAPPSRLNAQVPRDLETICLKCLHKTPSRRYATARDLSDDLCRFLEGKPILARRVGAGERVVKWARRRPAAALLVAAFVAMAGAALGCGVWMHDQEVDRRAAKALREERARTAIEAALNGADDLRRAERWREADLVLTDAATHLAEADSPPLEERLRHMLSDVRTAAELERVRESRPLDRAGSVDYHKRSAEFREIFDRAGFLGADAGPAAASVQASEIREQLVAALDDWAVAAHKLNDDVLVKRLLEVARFADPGLGWRNDFRDVAAWQSADRLRGLADAAFTASPPPPAYQLALLGLLLRYRGLGYREAELLGEACRRHPGNFWLNREAGDAHLNKGLVPEAIGFFRAALVGRPENAGVHKELATALFHVGQVESALDLYRRAVELEPGSHRFRSELVFALARTGYWKDAEAECRRALDADPGNYTAPMSLANSLQDQCRHEEAIVLFQTTLKIKPDDFFANFHLARTFRSLHRHDEAVGILRKETQLLRGTATSPTRQVLIRELIAAGRPEEAIAEAQTALAVLPNDTQLIYCLGLALRAQGRLDEAAAAFRRVVEDPREDHIVPWELLATTQLDRRDFAEARKATLRRLALPATGAMRRAQRRQLELCDLLLAVGDRLPAMLAGRERPQDVPTQLALAEWCLKHKRLDSTAADYYASALTAQPSLADDREAGYRFNAACAAALAGCGVGGDAAQLDDNQQAELRKQALNWLTAEYEFWAGRHRVGKLGDRTAAAKAVQSWQRNEALAGVRDEQALARLLPHERRDWQTLWSKVATLAARDPAAKLGQARAHVGRRKWGEAAQCYAAAFELESSDDGTIWFEYAACQLLAGDREGYRRSCAQLLDRCQPAGPMRPYLAARACTLLTDAADDRDAPRRLSESELLSRGETYWSRTEQAALHFRDGRCKEAIPLLERSLMADGRPGRAVLSWLWLSLAYQKSGQVDESRRWFHKATSWLDQQEGRMPLESDFMGSHLHNWLEANVLRQEAEAQLRNPLP